MQAVLVAQHFAHSPPPAPDLSFSASSASWGSAPIVWHQKRRGAPAMPPSVHVLLAYPRPPFVRALPRVPKDPTHGPPDERPHCRAELAAVGSGTGSLRPPDNESSHVAHVDILAPCQWQAAVLDRAPVPRKVLPSKGTARLSIQLSVSLAFVLDLRMNGPAVRSGESELGSDNHSIEQAQPLLQAPGLGSARDHQMKAPSLATHLAVAGTCCRSRSEFLAMQACRSPRTTPVRAQGEHLRAQLRKPGHVGGHRHERYLWDGGCPVGD